MKKLFIGIVVALLVAALAVPAFAATLSDDSKKEINDLYDQIANLRKQLVEKYVDAGALTKEQGDQVKENIDNATKYQKDNSADPDNAAGYDCGGAAGGGVMGGYGGGMMGGYGGGYGGGMMGGYGGGMMGGYSNSGYYNGGSTAETI